MRKLYLLWRLVRRLEGASDATRCISIDVKPSGEAEVTYYDDVRVPAKPVTGKSLRAALAMIAKLS